MSSPHSLPHHKHLHGRDGSRFQSTAPAADTLALGVENLVQLHEVATEAEPTTCERATVVSHDLLSRQWQHRDTDWRVGAGVCGARHVAMAASVSQGLACQHTHPHARWKLVTVPLRSRSCTGHKLNLVCLELTRIILDGPGPQDILRLFALGTGRKVLETDVCTLVRRGRRKDTCPGLGRTIFCLHHIYFGQGWR